MRIININPCEFRYLVQNARRNELSSRAIRERGLFFSGFDLQNYTIREWSCTACGAEHDRDVNAARNILALGHERLAVGIPRL
jgi:hypothetical protein